MHAHTHTDRHRQARTCTHTHTSACKQTTTHTNTSVPQPAIAVKRRGAKSLAGLMAYPALSPKDRPMDVTSNPIGSGLSPVITSEFLGSQIANIPTTSRKVPNTLGEQRRMSLHYCDHTHTHTCILKAKRKN